MLKHNEIRSDDCREIITKLYFYYVMHGTLRVLIVDHRDENLPHAKIYFTQIYV